MNFSGSTCSNCACCLCNLQAYTFLPLTTMAVSVLWWFFLHPMKAWRSDRLGLLVMVASHVIKPGLFVVFAGTSFLRGYLLMMAAYWFTSECSVPRLDSLNNTAPLCICCWRHNLPVTACVPQSAFSTQCCLDDKQPMYAPSLCTSPHCLC